MKNIANKEKIKKLEDTIAELSQSKWISVDEPPKKDGTYICLQLEPTYLEMFLKGELTPGDDDIFGCVFENGAFTEIDFSGGNRDVQVSFWMPIPLPPKEKGNE